MQSRAYEIVFYEELTHMKKGPPSFGTHLVCVCISFISHSIRRRVSWINSQLTHGFYRMAIIQRKILFNTFEWLIYACILTYSLWNMENVVNDHFINFTRFKRDSSEEWQRTNRICHVVGFQSQSAFLVDSFSRKSFHFSFKRKNRSNSIPRIYRPVDSLENGFSFNNHKN